MFQDARLFPHLNVASNLKFALRRASGPRYASLDEAVSLLDLGRLMARRVHRLSGGERQRVAIGRALLSQPRLCCWMSPWPRSTGNGARRCCLTLNRCATGLRFRWFT